MLPYHKEKHNFALDLASKLEDEGFKVQWSDITEQDGTADCDIISTINLEDPYLYDVSEENYNKLMSYIAKLQSGILWLARPAQIDCLDHRHGLITGFARCIRSELLHDFATLEIQHLDSASVDSVIAVFRKFQQRVLSAEPNPEMEYALHNDVVHVSRYHPVLVSKELGGALVGDDPKHLRIDQYGQLGSLVWVQGGSVTIQDQEVEVDIRCVGLNFRVWAL